MFREMRRVKQVMSHEDTIAVLERNTVGVLAVSGDDGYPYAVPLSYVYADGKIYFHSAKAGHKLDAIERNSKVSFCVVDQDEIIPEEFTTYFRSAVAFGKARLLDGDAKMDAVLKLCRKYSPDESEESLQKALDGSFANMAMVEIEIEHLSGKEAIELVKK